MTTVTMSAIIVTLFLGGPNGPHIGFISRTSPIWFIVKLFVFLFSYVWLRATLPRFRYDQLMDLGWKVLIPLSLGWLLILATLRLNNRWYGVIAGVVGVLAWIILMRAIDVGRARVEESGQLDQVP